MKHYYYSVTIRHLFSIFLLLGFLFSASVGWGQTLSGLVLDKEGRQPLIGAIVQVLESKSGAYTDDQGRFSIPLKGSAPVTVKVTYLGYDSLLQNVRDFSKRHRFLMKESAISIGEVQILAEGASELRNKLSLTVETMNLKRIENTTEASFYDGLAVLREVDILTVSFGFKVINTRGFNSSAPIRSLQLVDGIDNASPGLNYPLGNFVGVSELDIEGVDLVIGAGSAFFGPGAFNGVINMRSKSPFTYQGLDVMVKGGERDFFETGFRYAKAFGGEKGKEKWAFKGNGIYGRIYDWEANDLSASRSSTVDSIYEDNPGGYDAVNRYGDEVSADYRSLFEQFRHPGLGKFYRSGYEERDLVDYNSYNLKMGAALHFRPTEDVEIIAATNYGIGTTVMQLDNRLSLNGVWVMQNRFVIRKKDKFFLRMYSTGENAGDTYDVVSTASILQNRWRGSGDWLTGYKNSWFQRMNPRVKSFENWPTIGPPPLFEYDFQQARDILAMNSDSLTKWHQELRAGQDANALIPGTDEFNEVFNDIIGTDVSEGGTRYKDESKLYHVHGEYKFTPKFAEITLGANYRRYAPRSYGTIFSDTSGQVIRLHEFGIYTGIEKKFIDERLKITFALRMDKSKNYDFLFSPAASAAYQINSRNSLRVSLSSALRNPTLIEQYYYFRVGDAILLGNLFGYDNLITLDSFEEYLETDLDTSRLVRFSEPSIVPEKALAGEVAWSTVLLDGRMAINSTYYLNRYRDFIGYKIGLEVPFFMGFPGRPKIYRFSANAKDITITTGFSTGISYFISNPFTINANYSWNKILLVTDDPLIPAYNTPEHKFNIGISGSDFRIGNVENLSYAASFRWVEGYTFESAPQFTGRIPAQYSLNGQITKTFPKLNMLVKVAGSNLLNRKQNGLYGGPRIGRFVFAVLGFRIQ